MQQTLNEVTSLAIGLDANRSNLLIFQITFEYHEINLVAFDIYPRRGSITL